MDQEGAPVTQATSDADLHAFKARRSTNLNLAHSHAPALESLSAVELRQRLIRVQQDTSLQAGNKSRSDSAGNRRADETPASRAKREFREQQRLREISAAKETAARERIMKLQIEAERRQLRKQELVKRKQHEAAIKEIARRQRVEEANRLVALERAAKAEKAALRLAKLVESQRAATEARKLLAEMRYRKAEDQKSVSTWINRMVAEERREKAEAKREKVERLRKNVKLQEEARRVKHERKTNSVH